MIVTIQTIQQIKPTTSSFFARVSFCIPISFIFRKLSSCRSWMRSNSNDFNFAWFWCSAALLSELICNWRNLGNDLLGSVTSRNFLEFLPLLQIETNAPYETATFFKNPLVHGKIIHWKWWPLSRNSIAGVCKLYARNIKRNDNEINQNLSKNFITFVTTSTKDWLKFV